MPASVDAWLTLSSAAASPAMRRAGFIAALGSAAAFALAAPFAAAPLLPVPAFIPAYEAAIVLIDLITALLLFAQLVQQPRPALLALAAGYLFDALMVAPHALSFPGLITPTGWLGAGSQTTAWLYMFWHGGFPLFIIAYVALSRRNRRQHSAPVGPVLVLAVSAAVTLAAIGLAVIVTGGQDLLPAIMIGNGYAPAYKFVVGAVWGLTLLAVAALVANRPYSVLDLWLIVVMGAWAADIGLSAAFNAGRFDLGFYGGRLYGLLAASVVLVGLLVETAALHARLARLSRRLVGEADALEVRVAERTGELAAANRTLNAILAASPVGMFMLDPSGIVVQWTLSAERLFGYSADEALGRLPPYIVDGDELADFRVNLARTVDGPIASGWFETQRRHKSGAVMDLMVRWAAVLDDDGESLGVMYAVSDRTEMKGIESQLRQAQKMEAIGNLTGGMAHDFNNLLGIIIGNLDLLSERPIDDPEAMELVQEALDAASRSADLTRRLLAFARRQPLRPERVDVNELVGGITQLLKRTLGQNIEIALDLGAGVWPVVVDPAQLEASLTNLATNARDAMPAGGRLAVATRNRRLDEDYASLHAEVQPGDYALIEVSDSGSGISPEILSRIFEPFYTTKEPGKGTGLGLSMVFGFMKQSGGHINVYSEVGIGTIFRLYLPRAAAAADAAAPGARAAPSRGRGELVLAVEDKADLRRVVVRQLTELGYRVLEAEDAASAIAVLEAEPVDLLLTDVVMTGGASGYELAQMVLARWPAVKIILTSGFPELQVGAGALLSHLRLLTKPYRREDLGRALRETLDVAPPVAEPASASAG